MNQLLEALRELPAPSPYRYAVRITGLALAYFRADLPPRVGSFGGLILLPSLWLLFRVFKARNPQARA